MSGSHPGFEAVSAKVANEDDPRRPGQKIGRERARAILAARSRAASSTAKRRNPRLRRVK